MVNQKIMRNIFWLTCALLLMGEGDSSLFGFKEKFSKPERTITLCDELEILLPKNFKTLKIWIPLPKTNLYQKVDMLKIESPFAEKIMEEKEFGNQLLYFESKEALKEDKAAIKVCYRIKRKEQRPGNDSSFPDKLPLSKFLKERGLERINGKIKAIAAELTHGKKEPMAKAKAIYDYVLGYMQYDKSGKGWGRGDSIYACEVGKGNCTDFHSLFIALARASGIPARFQMGISLPQSSEGNLNDGYHCWAEFYVEGKGWIPVDISEAWKNPKKAHYLFGNLDVDRILISTGRELVLSPKQEGAPLNYLSKPYIELDSKPFNSYKFQRTFKDLN